MTSEEHKENDEKQSAGHSLMKGLLLKLGLFIIVGIYAIGGAYGFIALETPNEEAEDQKNKVAALNVNQSINYFVQITYKLHQKYLNATGNVSVLWENEVTKDLILLRNQIVKATQENEFANIVENKEFSTSWTLPSTVLFTLTLMSTIGYGHIYPVTLLGRVFCILYSMVGIPLLLVFLANIGDSMADAFTYSYSRMCCHWCRAKRRLSEMSGGKKTLPKLSEEDIGEELYMPTNEVSVPIMLNLVLIFFYIMLGGAIFSYTEDWNMTTAVYFTYITLSTIGLGDLVPGKKSFMEDKTSMSAAGQMVGTILYILIGMALVSMCLNLMQEQLVEKFRNMARSLGFGKEEGDKVPVKKSAKPVRETTREPVPPKKPPIPSPSPPPKKAIKYEAPKPMPPKKQFNPFKPSRELAQSPIPSEFIPGTPNPV